MKLLAAALTAGSSLRFEPKRPLKISCGAGKWNAVRPEISAAFYLSVSINEGAGHISETFAIALKAVFASVRARGYAAHTQEVPSPDGSKDIIVTIDALDCYAEREYAITP